MREDPTLSDSVSGDVTLPQPALQAAVSAVKASTSRDFTPPAEYDTSRRGFRQGARVLDLAHDHSFATFAILVLIIGVAAIKVGGDYWSNRIISSQKPAGLTRAVKPTIAGLNLTVPASELQSKLQTITHQPATLAVGSTTVPVGADTIRSWFQITSSKDKSEDYISIKAGAINSSLMQLAKQFVSAPVNQVTVSTGGTSAVVVAGRNGTALSDPSSLKVQADQVAKTVMDSKGLKFSTPLVSQPFQAVTPCAFPKSIYADVTTKTMGAFQGCNQVNHWLVSAGAPATPTPIGSFRIYAKFTVQDMSGFNPNGSKYFQPRVPWVNYFYEGSAIHGVYWHPLSWFGNRNSSHGCVGVPVNEAEWIFNWAPIGTPVITTANPNLNFASATST